MIHRKLSRHFVPHYFVDPEAVAHERHDEVHHRAHAIALPALFIYLQVLVFATASFYFIGRAAPRALGAVTFSQEEIVRLTNEKRGQAGLPNLVENKMLSQAATAKASDMFANNYWAHYSPGGKTPWSFITASGYKYIYAGENLARDFDNPKSVVDAWMNSSSHRSNLLDKNFKDIGVAVSYGKLDGKEGILVVQMFGAGPSSLAVNKSTNDERQTTNAEGRSAGVETYVPSNSQNDAGQELKVFGTKEFFLSKSVALVFVGFIFMLFALEAVITLRRAHVHLKSGVVAHLILLGFVLFAVWYSTAGAII